MSDIKLSSLTFNGGQTQDVLLLDQPVGHLLCRGWRWVADILGYEWIRLKRMS